MILDTMMKTALCLTLTTLFLAGATQFLIAVAYANTCATAIAGS